MSLVGEIDKMSINLQCVFSQRKKFLQCCVSVQLYNFFCCINFQTKSTYRLRNYVQQSAGFFRYLYDLPSKLVSRTKEGEINVSHHIKNVTLNENRNVPVRQHSWKLLLTPLKRFFIFSGRFVSPQFRHTTQATQFPTTTSFVAGNKFPATYAPFGESRCLRISCHVSRDSLLSNDRKWCQKFICSGRQGGDLIYRIS